MNRNKENLLAERLRADSETDTFLLNKAKNLLSLHLEL